MKKFSKISQLNDPNKNNVSCNYYDLNYFNKFIVKKQDLAVLYLRISTLSSYINELKYLLSGLNLNFDIICISESRTTKSNLPTSSIHVPGTTLNKHSQNLLQVVHWFIYLKNFFTETDQTFKYTTLNIWNSPSLRSSFQICPSA